MARTAEQIQADIDSVRAEMSNPVQQIHFGDRGMTKRSTGDAEKALAALERELQTANATAASTPRVRQVRLFGSSGF